MDLDILFSAGHQYNGNGFKHPNICEHNELFMDSGGFQLIGQYGEYPFENEEYLHYAEEINPDFLAPLDYPCDGVDNPIKGVNISNDERIKRTVENDVFLLDNYEGEGRVVPVIQGYDVEEYKNCVNRLKERGAITEYMGVGSICRRKKSNEVYEILKTCKEMTNSKLHVFGLSLNLVKMPKIRHLINSFDTMSWMYSSTRFGRPMVFTGKRMVKLHTKGPQNSEEENIDLDDEEIQFITLKGYKEYYDYLCNKWNKQNKLDEFL